MRNLDRALFLHDDHGGSTSALRCLAVIDERYDFFLSRRGSVAAIAREVADALTEKGYEVLVQDYDIPHGASFIEAMHEAVKNSRDLVILFTSDTSSRLIPGRSSRASRPRGLRALKSTTSALPHQECYWTSFRR
jgi:TIR domain